MNDKPSTYESEPTGPTDLSGIGGAPVDTGAGFACSWSGPDGGQIIVRGNVLHINAGGQSAAIPAERLQGWTSREHGEHGEHGEHVELTLQSIDELHVRIPTGLFLAVERALQGLR